MSYVPWILVFGDMKHFGILNHLMHGKLKELLRIHHVSIKLEEGPLTFHSNLILDMKVEHPTSATYHRQAINTKDIKRRQLSKAEDWSMEGRLLMDVGHL